MPKEKKKFNLELTQEEALALREVVHQIDDHSSWMLEVMKGGDLLPGIYKKIYEMTNETVRKMNEEAIKEMKKERNANP